MNEMHEGWAYVARENILVRLFDERYGFICECWVICILDTIYVK